MIKENIKPIIIGLFFIIGVIIYTEQTKYEIVDNDTGWGGIDYLLLNKKSGETIRYIWDYEEDTIDIHKITKDGETTYDIKKVEDLTKEE